MIRLFCVVLFQVLVSGCTTENDNQLEQSELCSPAWLIEVNKQVSSDDGDGHGPDIGSNEWKWVITRRLKLDKLPTLPEIDSQQWCEFIDLELTK